MPDAVIDAATLAALRETAGADFVDELIDTFLDEAPRIIADLRDAKTRGDAERFRRAAHSLKSNAATFGATALESQARALERDGMAHADEGRLAALDASYAAASTTLRHIDNA